MIRTALLVSAALVVTSLSAAAQEAAPAPAEAVPAEADQGEIIVTATRRNEALSSVPIAVSAISAASLANSGASDIRQLNQLSPSLLVSSTSSEAGAGVARIRGIGTVGDNPGLESSVGTFIDGVYRSRSGVALSELGAVERIEVLRGPQGTLFGRNTSAGLINIVTQKPSFENEGNASFTYGNFDAIRAEGGFTGPILGGDTVALRVDGVYFKRDGFLKDVISGRRVNDRDRWLVRAQALVRPTDDLDIRIIGDYADRREECCGSVYAPLRDRVRAPGTPVGQIGDILTEPASFASVLRGLRDPAGNAVILNDVAQRRETAITPGRTYTSNVTDWGLSGEVNWRLGDVNLTSITAYRDYTFKRGQDADYNNLDLFYRDNFKQKFETFSQELRLQGQLFDDRINWLVGGYYAHEDLTVRDNLRFGAQFGDYAGRSLAFTTPSLAAFPALGGFANLPGVINALIPATVPGFARTPITSLVPVININNTGVAEDNYKQTSSNFAIFTHNQFKVTDRLTLTLGLRYTNEEKTLDTSFVSDNTQCAAIRAAVNNVAALSTTNPIYSNPALASLPPTIAGTLRSLSSFPCLVNLNTTVDGVYVGKKKEDKLTGTAVLSYKPVDRLLVYASYSRGYKAGGFNLDRSAFNPLAPSVNDLIFEPETVDAYEAGAKFDGRRIDVNVAVFRQEFEQFQLNTFNGLNFLVENIQACSDPLLPRTGTSYFGGCDPAKLRSGVTSTGVELEIFLYPARNFQVSAGVTYAETKYRDRLVGVRGRAIPNDLFLLPNRDLSNAPRYVATASATWTPSLGSTGYSGLLYADTRLQSRINTGSDLDIEKEQEAFVLVNARIGIRAPENRFAVEFWGQNIFNEIYTQVAFDAPLQPIGGIQGARVTQLPAGATLANGAAFAANRSTALFGRFLGEPRTYGVTVRTKF